MNTRSEPVEIFPMNRKFNMKFWGKFWNIKIVPKMFSENAEKVNLSLAVFKLEPVDQLICKHNITFSTVYLIYHNLRPKFHLMNQK